VTYLDTHVVAWLYAGRRDLLSDAALQCVQSEELHISPIVTLELQFLYEIGRISVAGRPIVEDLQRRVGLRVCDAPFYTVISAALKDAWTRDPFDRVIVGHAASRQAALVTKDQAIRDHYRQAVW